MTKAERAEKKKRQPIKEYLKERIKNIPLTVIMALMAGFFIFSMVYFPVIGRWRDGLISLVYLLIIPLFYFSEWSLGMRVPVAYTVFLMLFVLFCHLGACFNFYYLIPRLDDILHAAWGIVFGTIGIILIKSLMGPAKDNKAVIIYVLFGLGFAMLLSVVWEIWEFCGDSLIPDMDMQQDTIVDSIHSFIMYPDPAHPNPDNLHTWQVEGIAYTVLYNSAGEEIGRIPNGYLDTGLIDTMMDLIFCFSFVAVFSIVLAIDWCKGKVIYHFFIPALNSEVEERKAKRLAKKATANGATQTEAEETVEEKAEEIMSEDKEVL
ncbi:MAG: hypothetical protein ACI4MS_00755 [Candidatus Coproplasma sp.]